LIVALTWILLGFVGACVVMCVERRASGEGFFGAGAVDARINAMVQSML
jgi:hypothetical protein